MNLLFTTTKSFPIKNNPVYLRLIMAEELIIADGGGKEEKYQTLLPQIEALISVESDVVANLANVSAVLKSTFGFFWVGFYRVIDGELVLGPFQGPLACTRIRKGKGVCGTSWEKAETLLIDDVEQFPGHIACSSDSKSEIVVPVFDTKGEVCMVLDVDSDQLADFDATDKKYLEQLAAIITNALQQA